MRLAPLASASILSAAALGLTSCAFTRFIDKPVYTYAAQPDSAYIKGSEELTDGILGKYPGVMIWPVLVDDARIDYRTLPTPQAGDKLVPLAPGRHTVKAELRAESIDNETYLDFYFNALPKETYTLHEHTEWNEGLLGNSVKTITVWIEDSHGNKSGFLTLKRDIKVITTTTYMPKVKVK